MDDIYSAEKVWALTEKHYPDQLKEHAFAEMIAISSHHRSWTDVMDLYNRMKAGNIVRDNKVYAFVLKVRKKIRFHCTNISCSLFL